MLNKKKLDILNNEIKLSRKVFVIIIPILLIVVLCSLIFTKSFSNLMGNSVTEYYCEDSTYKLEGNKCVKEIKEKSVLLGDVNLDDNISNEDLSLISRYIDFKYYEEEDEEISKITELQVKAADINQDGQVFYADESLLREYLDKSTSTLGAYQEDVGVKRLCNTGFELNGTDCIKRYEVDALIRKNEDSNYNKSNTNNIDINNSMNKDTIDDNNNLVDININPQDNNTNLKVNSNYNLDINFDIKGNNTYYYVYSDYQYGKLTYSSSCSQVTENSKTVSFKVNGTKKINVKVYSDNKCENEIKSVDSNTYTCDGCTNMVSVTFKPQDNKLYAPYNSKYKLNVNFDVNDEENTYYYIWTSYLNGKKNNQTKCSKITSGEKYGAFNMNGKRMVNVTYYSDPTCKNQIKSVDSKQYICSDCKESIDVKYKYDEMIDNGYPVSNYYISWYYYKKMPNYLKVHEKEIRETYIDNFDSSTVWANENIKRVSDKKNIKHSVFDKASLYVSFDINDTSKQYYYKWEIYDYYNKRDYASSCQKVNNKDNSATINVKGDRYGAVSIYSDSSCKNKIETTYTRKIKMKGVYDYMAYAYVETDTALTGDSGYDIIGDTVVKKGTKVNVRGKIEIVDYKKNHYYRWELYNDNLRKTTGRTKALSNCTKAIDNKIVSTTVNIDSPNSYVYLYIYNDSKCSSVSRSNDARKFYLTSQCKKKTANINFGRKDASAKYFYSDCK